MATGEDARQKLSLEIPEGIGRVGVGCCDVSYTKLTSSEVGCRRFPEGDRESLHPCSGLVALGCWECSCVVADRWQPSGSSSEDSLNDWALKDRHDFYN